VFISWGKGGGRGSGSGSSGGKAATADLVNLN